MNYDATSVRVLALSVMIATLISSQYPAAARGSFATENPWAAEHIDALPPDIRRAVARRERACGGGTTAARHYFSVSLDASGRRFIALHFENFHCPSSGAVCNPTGCLHEIFVEKTGRQVLVFAASAYDVKMTNIGGAAGLEVTRGGTKTAFKWNGRQFMRAQ